MKFDRLRPVQRRRLLWALRAFSWTSSASLIWVLIAIGRPWEAVVWLGMAIAFEILSAWGRSRSRSAVSLRGVGLDWERLQALRDECEQQKHFYEAQGVDFGSPPLQSIRTEKEGGVVRVTHIDGVPVEDLPPQPSFEDLGLKVGYPRISSVPVPSDLFLAGTKADQIIIDDPGRPSVKEEASWVRRFFGKYDSKA